MTVAEMLVTQKWKPIAHCPGRYVLAEPAPALAPEQLAEVARAPVEFRSRQARDTILVLSLEGGGLISYRRKDGSYYHTLNDEFGLRRKLAQLDFDSSGGGSQHESL